MKSILVSKAHDITAFASNDPSRFAIQGVHFNADKKRLEATDGRMLITLPVLESEEFPPVATPAGEVKDCIIPVGPFKKALGNIPKKSNLPILEHARLDVNGKVTLTTTDLDDEQAVTSKPIDAQYPNIDAVQPKAEPKLSICLQASLLRTICDYFAKHGKGDQPSVKLTFIDELSPVQFSGRVEGDLTASGLLMPMRMS